ncbi:MAG: response regulator, partial [Deltaproteobacteria bacterium]
MIIDNGIARDKNSIRVSGSEGSAFLSGAILIAEDQELARKNIQRFLQQQGYKVEEAADGIAAMEAINNADFDLVITDL